MMYDIIRRVVLVLPTCLYFKLADQPLDQLAPKDQLVKIAFKYNANDVAHTSYENLDDLKDIVDFEVEGEENVFITRNITDDPWLNKLVGNGTLIGQTDDATSNLGGRFNHEENDPEDDIVDPKFKAKPFVRYPSFDPSTPWDQCQPLLGKKFENPQQLKYMLANYGVANGYQLWFMQNDYNDTPDDAECSSKHATKKNDHKCCRNYTLGSLVTYKWIAHHYAREIIDNPSLTHRYMQNFIKEKFLLHVSLVQCKRAKICALYDHKGGLIEHYNKLWEYRQVVLESNPGSACHLETEDKDDDGKITFKRMYICFKGIKQGWLDACRKVIGLDCCFLTHTCKGQLLTAIGRDGNNQMYPIAWAVVGVENKDNWAWFMSLLQEDLELGYGGGLTVISDGHKGLLEAVADFQDNELNVHQVSVDLPVNEAPENYTTEESQAEDPDPKPINRGRSERIAMMKAKKSKFAVNGTGSNAEKAFDVFEDEE
ncbi:uncharacterized protein Tco_0766094 [Tanacetum coccineum]